MSDGLTVCIRSRGSDQPDYEELFSYNSVSEVKKQPKKLSKKQTKRAKGW